MAAIGIAYRSRNCPRRVPPGGAARPGEVRATRTRLQRKPRTVRRRMRRVPRPLAARHRESRTAPSLWRKGFLDGNITMEELARFLRRFPPLMRWWRPGSYLAV